MNTALNYQPEVLVDTADLSREDWLNYRRLGIGGSDAAAIMGLSPFATIRDLYFDKIGVTPVIEEEEENWVAKEVGHRLEDLVAMIFAKKTGLEVFPVRKMFRHPLYPFMLADVDYFIRFPDGSIGILECKTCNYNAKDKWADDGIPENYVLQVRHYLAVMNMNKAYLSCGSLKGIGPKTAERIVNRFGLDTLEVMEKYPQELLKIQGISQKKLDRIVDSFGKNKVFRELMTFLSPFHVTPKKANMILQKFRDQSVEIIRKQPYILCSVKGFGFLTVDAIARQCCAATNDPMRISGCVSYVLREAMKQNGHLYLEQEILVKDALKVLNKEPDLQPVTETEILKVLYRLVMQDSIVVEENRVYITKQHQEEEDTASMIARKLHEQIPVLTIEKELEEAQEDLNITLSERQKEAVRMVFANPICIITGGPGTGKTTVLKVILYIYQKKCGNEVKLMAPTGRAARRMAESTGNGDATTMHMALGLFGDGDYEALTDKLSADFINADEVSMVDMHLAYEFFYKVKAGARVLLVGDVHQLPSVGAGDVFRQLILCGKIPVTVLNLVYRQGKDSNIPINAQLINEGKTNLQWGDDFQMVECSGADAAAQIVKNIYLKEIQMYGMEQVQILSPYKVRSAAGVLELNRSLQDEVNPPVSGKRELHLGGEIFREGDRILQNKNTEFASNGDLGTLVQIAEDEDNNPLVQIVFTDGRRVKYEAEQVEMIEHANAITIHKSQGSECQVVIIPWLKAFYPMLKRNIFYTGITRAKQRVYIVGEWKAVCQAIHTDDTGTRKTMLAVKIQQYCERYQRQENRRIPATICNRAV